jgi:hypothetical protein
MAETTPNLDDARVAHGGELLLELGAGLHASSWRGDLGGGTNFKLGYRSKSIVGFDFAISEQLSAVDTRINSGLSIGFTLTPKLDDYRLPIRLFGMHQHEQAWTSVKESPATVLLGIGDGIRHRVGFGVSTAFEIPFQKSASTVWYLAPGAAMEILPSTTLGPALYGKLTFGIGFRYSLPGLP